MRVTFKPDMYLQVLNKEYEGKKYFAGQVLCNDKDYQNNDKSEIVEVSISPENLAKYEAIRKAGKELTVSIRRNPKSGSTSFNFVS